MDYTVPFHRPWNPVPRDFSGIVSGGAGRGYWTGHVESRLEQIHSGVPVRLTTSCSDALEMAALAENVSPGDEIIVPDFGFVTSASAFVLRGARLVFADVEPGTLVLNPDSVTASVSPKTTGIVSINYGGHGGNLPALREIADSHGLWFVEDNAHGLGGTAHGRPLGTWGDLATASFHETKNISCGEGGAIIVNDLSLLSKIEVILEKGTNRKSFFEGLADKYTWQDLGSSYVLSDFLARLLAAQLDELDAIQRRRHVIWSRYREELAGWAQEVSVILPPYTDKSEHSAHLFHMLLPEGTRPRFIQALKDAGVGSAFHYQSLSNSPAGAKFGSSAQPVFESLNAERNLVRLPLYPSLSDEQVEIVISAVKKTGVL